MLVTGLLNNSIFRTLYLSARFRGRIIVRRGTFVRLDPGARIVCTPGSRLLLGPRSYVRTPCALHIRRNGSLSIDGQVTIHRGTRVVVGEGAHLEMGPRSYINYNSTVACYERITIGSDCAISWDTTILDGNVHELVVAGVPKPRTRPVHIGDNVWIGTGAIIVGASIGSGSVVGAGSVVTTDIDPAALAAGNPARVIRKDITWRL
jgi:acetyltransferase-like isoleucine patch superfamily enzyme